MASSPDPRTAHERYCDKVARNNPALPDDTEFFAEHAARNHDGGPRIKYIGDVLHGTGVVTADSVLRVSIPVDPDGWTRETGEIKGSPESLTDESHTEFVWATTVIADAIEREE